MDKNLSCHSGSQLFLCSFQDILSLTPVALEHITLKRTLFLLFNYLKKIQSAIRVSAEQRMCCTCTYILHATFLVALKATVWSLFLCHYAPVCRCLRVMERALGNIYILNPLYRPRPSRRGASDRGGFGGEASGSQRTRWHESRLSCTPSSSSRESGTLYGDCFYQRSCPSPGRPKPKEDDPHFLKAKCSVLISRNEQPVTRVNLLNPGRFIVSCHSWTHRADL